MNCRYCMMNVDLPFKCKFCGGYFCSDHRLPENHSCPEIHKVKDRGSPPIEFYGPADNQAKVIKEPNHYSSKYFSKFNKTGLTNQKEIIHLTLGSLIVMVVGLSWNDFGLAWIFRIFKDPVNTLISAILFTSIFISHELAHKTVAKYYGMWAEFRLNLVGAALTLLSAVSPLIKIVSPGAIMISGVSDRKTLGITAFAGPITSIALSIMFFILYFLIPQEILAFTVIRGASLAAWISIFNLIPLGILDGAKIFFWNKTVWITSFLVSIVLTGIILVLF